MVGKKNSANKRPMNEIINSLIILLKLGNPIFLSFEKKKNVRGNVNADLKSVCDVSNLPEGPHAYPQENSSFSISFDQNIANGLKKHKKH